MKKRVIILTVVIAALSTAVAFLFLTHSFIPNPASAERTEIDNLMKLMFAIGGIIFVLVMVILIYSVIVFRRRGGDTSDGPAVREFFPLELAWTLIPLAIVVALGVYGGIVLNKISEPAPGGSQLVVNVTAFQFGWSFEYPDQKITSFELRLPVDRQVMFHMESRDVVHSFWIPELGPKMEVVPGMSTMLAVTPTKIGQYQVKCAQLCGLLHAYMTAPVKVVSAADFQEWVTQQQSKK